MNKKRIGIIGCGHWGPNQVRNFFFHPKVDLVRICDIDEERLKHNQLLYKVQISTNYKDITQAKDIDAVVICTPVVTHYEIAKDALLNEKDVLCEKPFTIKSSDAEELIKIARDKNLILMMGHVFIFNSGILKLKELIKFKELGEIYYLYSQRTNLGIYRPDVNVVYDLASHDIYILNFLLDSYPKVISAIGKGNIQENKEDVAFINLEYPGNILAHIHVSWLDPKKAREITVVGTKKMATWNDMFSARPIEIYSKHIEKEPYYKDYGEFQLIAKEGEVLIPSVKIIEPLKLQTDHFIECIEKRGKPLPGGESGLRVVQTLEEIDKIFARNRESQKVFQLS